MICIYQFFVYNLSCTVTDIIHLSYPQHLILCFQLFGYAFLFGKLFNKSVKHFVCFFINIGKISGELTACQKIGVNDMVMIFEIMQTPLAPNTYFNLWLFG